MRRGGYGSATSSTTYANRAVRLSVSTKKPRLEAPKSRLLARSMRGQSGPLPDSPKHTTQQRRVKEEAPGGVLPGLEERLTE